MCLKPKGKISIFDRGFLFADGVYEVSAVVNGKLVDYDPPTWSASAVR
jgi:D-alanine transaminase